MRAGNGWPAGRRSLFLNVFDQRSAGDADHRPADHGFVMRRKAFVVADASSVTPIQARVCSTTQRLGRMTKPATSSALSPIWSPMLTLVRA